MIGYSDIVIVGKTPAIVVHWPTDQPCDGCPFISEDPIGRTCGLICYQLIPDVYEKQLSLWKL